jgi:predicted MFS family arabinose efflux permease
VLTGGLVLLMAVGSGVSSANNYYIQPLLHTVSHTFSVGSDVAGLIVTLGQLGYVLGLVFLVPLGDRVERRRLITCVTALAALCLLGMATAPDIRVLMGFALLTGVCTVSAQIFVPFVAQLATDADRGRLVGKIMSGLLIGILLGRTVAGLIAQAAGWRTVYVVAACLMLALCAACRIRLPSLAPTTRTSYRGLLRSVVAIYAAEPVLRRRGLYGALTYGAFGVFWTAIAFQLAGHYHYGEATIGLFGLLGVAGAMCAQVAGRIADAGWGRIATAVFMAVLLASWAALYAGGHRLGWLIVGILALDLGVQGTHISNQSEVYRLRPDARSRLTTGYMCSYFLGGVTGSALSAAVYAGAGWTGVCVLGAACPVVALTAWATEARWPLRRMRRDPAVGGSRARQSRPPQTL